VRAGALAGHQPGGLYVDVAAVGDDDLNLLDHYSRVESVLQLISGERGFSDRALLHEADGGHVGDRLGDEEFADLELARDVEPADYKSATSTSPSRPPASLLAVRDVSRFVADTKACRGVGVGEELTDPGGIDDGRTAAVVLEP